MAKIPIDSVSPDFPIDFSITPLNYLSPMKIYDGREPERIVLEYFNNIESGKYLPLLPDFIIQVESEFPIERLLSSTKSNIIGDKENLSSSYRETLSNQEMTWMPINLENCGGNNYSIYLEIVNRIDKLDRLIQILKLPMDIVQALYEIQDRYQLLSIYIEKNGIYKNDELFHRDNQDNCPLTIFRPRPSISFTIASLPDMTLHIAKGCQLWGESIDKNVFTNPDITLLLSMIRKVWPTPCEQRSLAALLVELIEALQHVKRSNFLCDVNARFILASLCGVYPGTTGVVTNFHVRHILYRYFSLQMGLGGEWIQHFVGNHKFLIVYIIREYLFFIVDRLPALKTYLNDHYYWFQITQNTRYVMDYIRAELNKSIKTYGDIYPILDRQGEFIRSNFEHESAFFQLATGSLNANIHWHPSESIFQSIERVLDNFNKTNLSYCYRKLSKPVLDIICHKINDLENKGFDDKYHQQMFKRRWENVENFKTDEVLPVFYEYWIEYLVTRARTLENPPTYHFLALIFKVSLVSIYRLDHAQILYESETNRSEIVKVLADIKLENPRDFHILSIFFKALEKRASIIVYALPANIAEKQLAGELKYYSASSVEQLPKGFGSYYICTNCNEFKGCVYEPHLNDNYIQEDVRYLTFGRVPIELTHTDFSNNIMLDLRDRQISCSHYSFKADRTAKNSLGNISNNDIIANFVQSAADINRDSKKKSRDVHKKEHYLRCACGPLEQLCLIGFSAYTDLNGHFTKCIGAGCRTIIKLSPEWSRIGCTGEMFACNRCQVKLQEEEQIKRGIILNNDENQDHVATTTTLVTDDVDKRHRNSLQKNSEQESNRGDVGDKKKVAGGKGKRGRKNNNNNKSTTSSSIDDDEEEKTRSRMNALIKQVINNKLAFDEDEPELSSLSINAANTFEKKNDNNNNQQQLITSSPYSLSSAPSTPTSSVLGDEVEDDDNHRKRQKDNTSSLPTSAVSMESDFKENNNKKKKSETTEDKKTKKKRVQKFYNNQLPLTQQCCLCLKKTRPKTSAKLFLKDDSNPKDKGIVVIRCHAFCKHHETLYKYASKHTFGKTMMYLSDLKTIDMNQRHVAEYKKRLYEKEQKKYQASLERMESNETFVNIASDSRKKIAANEVADLKNMSTKLDEIREDVPSNTTMATNININPGKDGKLTIEESIAIENKVRDQMYRKYNGGDRFYSFKKTQRKQQTLIKKNNTKKKML